MRFVRLSTLAVACILSSCGGGDSGGGSGPAPSPSPAPPPVPAPTPTPSPAPQTALSYLHVFSITVGDGAQPNGPLVQARDGNFYGTTRAGGANTCRGADAVPCGTVFRIKPNGEETVLYSFGASNTDGYAPTAPLVQGSDGALYGLTSSGGDYGGGTVFKIALDGTYRVIHSFGASAADGVVPLGGLVVGNDGNLYGVTASGGSHHCSQIPQDGGNCGTIFKVSPAGAESVIYSFGSSPADGVEPNGSLLLANDGNFYGTTASGGANACSTTGETNDCGTLFRITPAGKETVLHSFGASANDGIAPEGGLVQGADGALYGSTLSGGGGRCGGSFGCGTLYRVTTSGALTLLHTFALESTDDGDGPSPLILGGDGYLYGTTGSGGASCNDLCGTVFRVAPSGAFSTLFSFGPLDVNPSNPLGGLVRGSDGAFYGITNYNGTYGASGARGGSGTVFKLLVKG